MKFLAMTALVASISAVDNNQEETLAALPLTDEVMVEEQTKEEEEAALSALKDAMYAAHEDQMVEVDSKDQEQNPDYPGWYNGRWGLLISHAHYGGKNVLNKVLHMYMDGEREFPASNALFTDPQPGKTKQLKIVYSWNGKQYTKIATEWDKSSNIKMPDATRCSDAMREAPAPAGTKRLLFKSIGLDHAHSNHWSGKNIVEPARWNSKKAKQCFESSDGVPASYREIEANFKDGVHVVKQIRVYTQPSQDKGATYTAKNAEVYAGWKLCGTLGSVNTCKWDVINCPAGTRANFIGVRQYGKVLRLEICGMMAFGN